MRASLWSVRDARNRFSKLMEAARQTPQTVTRYGKPAVVIVPANEYERLRRHELLQAPRFSDHLLAMPTDDGEFKRLRAGPREPQF